MNVTVNGRVDPCKSARSQKKVSKTTKLGETVKEKEENLGPRARGRQGRSEKNRTQRQRGKCCKRKKGGQ